MGVYSVNNLFIKGNKICVRSYTSVSYFVINITQPWVQLIVTRPVIHFQPVGFRTGFFTYFNPLNMHLYSQSTEPINNHNKRKNEKGNN